MGVLNFIKALIVDVRLPEVTKLRRINVDESYMTQMEMFKYSDGSTDNPKEVGQVSEVTELLMHCPVLLNGVTSNK